MKKVLPIYKLFPQKQFNDKICLSPFQSIEINKDGDIGLCPCEDWHPIKVGNLFEQPLKDILSNPLSQKIRKSIVDGTYEYCDEKKCAVIKEGWLISKDSIGENLRPFIDDVSSVAPITELWIAGDSTCNLSCPSCRTSVIKNSEDEVDKLKALGKKLKENVFPTGSNEPIVINVSTSGEVFASPLLLSFIRSLDPKDFPNLELNIQTNGLLAPRNWHKLGPISNQVRQITVTTDAATAATYEVLRRGGKWPDIQEALQWISQKKKQNGMRFHLRMVAQKLNYREIPDFYHQAKQLGVDRVEFARFTDWGTYSKDEFFDHDVFSNQHPEYEIAQDFLDQVKRLDDVVLLGDLH